MIAKFDRKKRSEKLWKELPCVPYCRGRSFRNFKKKKKKAFITLAGNPAPRPGLWRPIRRKEGFYFLHAQWHHWFLHRVHGGSLNAAVCVGGEGGGNEISQRFSISFAVSLRMPFHHADAATAAVSLCCSFVRTALLRHLWLWPHRAFCWIFSFVALKDATWS